ncbi:MAG: SusC/RagA family TonB-linked outer membrane protein [Saprospiraceae bacterium]|nr:SusC/RagA family TonB-linked outer membrane protein [Saprospiraceae bacterium]
MKQLVFTFLFLMVTLTVFGQRKITGLVTNAAGEPQIGANIAVKNAPASGSITDFDGKYEITVPQDGKVLVFSYTGFETKEVEIGASDVIDVIMDEGKLLEEVVVTALGFTTKKDRSGSTASSVNKSAIKSSGEPSLLNSLAGKASGVKITRANGDPGAGTNIQIRGANTIGGSSQPLVIVDGVPMSNDNLYGSGSSRSGGVSQSSRINDINPEDVESIQILKGASAAALWGSRAANGVLMITTKSGKLNQKMKISVSSSYSIDEINRRHPLQSTFGQGAAGVFSAAGANSWGDKIDTRSGAADEVNTTGQRFVGDDGRIVYPITKKNSKETFVDENFNSVFQNGFVTDNNITFSGGGAKTNNYFSVGYLAQEGIVKNSEYTRATVRFNNQTFMSDKFVLSTKANYIYSSANRIQQNSNTAGLYLGLLRTPADFDNSIYRGTHISATGVATSDRQRSYRRYLGDNINPTWNNPLWTTNEQKAPTTVNRFAFSTNLNYSPVKWLQLDLRGGLDGYTDERTYFSPVGSAAFNAGRLETDLIRNSETNVDLIARTEFGKIMNDMIGVNGTLGFNINDRLRKTNFTGAQVFLAPADLQNFNNTAAPYEVSNSKNHIRSNRLYGILTLDYDDQIFVNLSGTQEAASSVAGTYFYPSADIAWQFTKSIIPANDILSFGKVRLSYGQVGVQPAAYRFGTTYEQFAYSTYDDALDINEFGGGFRLNDDQGNPNLKPEIKTEFEIGTDLRFLKDKVTLGLTYYKNTINDILLAINLAPSSGFLSKYGNAAKMENKGFEIDLGIKVLDEQKFGLEIYGNFNNNRNKILDLAGVERLALTDQSITSNAIVGQPLGILFASKAARKADGSLALNERGFPTLAPEQGIVGDPNPDWRGGAGIRGRYGKLNFNVLFETYQGADFAERTKFVLHAFGTYENVGREVTLTKDVINSTGKMFTAGTTVRGNIENFGAGDVLLDESWYTTLGGGLCGSAINEFAVADGSWTRLREVSLEYSFSGKALSKIAKLSSIDVSISGRNLAIWTDILGIDPEVNQSGVDNGFGIEYFTNPSTKSWVASVKLNF